MAWIVDIQGVVIERGQRAGDTAHDRHRVGVTAKRVEQTGNLLVDHGMAGNDGLEFVVLFLVRLFTVQQDVAHFEVVGLGR